jgi:hypothetical protein
MSQNLYAWQRYIIIIIIIIVVFVSSSSSSSSIIIMTLFGNTQIYFAVFCKYGKKNSRIISVDIS